MGFLDKAKAAVEQGAAKAKDAAEDVQQKRDLNATYSELGKTAFDLIESGAFDAQFHADLNMRAFHFVVERFALFSRQLTLLFGGNQSGGP